MILNEILINVTSITLVSSIILIYFGKIISDARVEVFQKTELLIEGLYFTLFYILFPIILILFLYQKEKIINLNFYFILFIQMVILFSYYRYYSFKTLMKYDLKKEYNAKFNKAITDVKEKNPNISKILQPNLDLANYSLKLFNKIAKILENKIVMFLISFILFYTMFILIKTETDILSLYVIGLFLFLNISLIALSYGISTTYYPISKINLVDGKIIEGKTLKFGEFIYIINLEKKFFINKNQVISIEQKILKEENEN